MNFLLRTDSYKFTHWKQYPPKTTGIYSYLESRGGMFPNTVFFGLQYYLKTYLEGPRFTHDDIVQADAFCRQHFGNDLFNRDGWTRLYEKYRGILPVRIKAVPGRHCCTAAKRSRYDREHRPGISLADELP